MATKFYCDDGTSGDELTGTERPLDITTQRVLKTTRATSTVNGPTAGVSMGNPFRFTTKQLNAVLISGTITFNVWAIESNMANNAGMQCLIERLDSEGNLLSTIVNSEFGTELGTTVSANNWTATPTSTLLNQGDRIRVSWLANDAGGTMVAAASGFTVQWGDSVANQADTWVQFTETITVASTRFYFSATAVPPISPAFSASWIESSTMIRRMMAPARFGSAMSDKQVTSLAVSETEGIIQLIAGPIAAQTINPLNLGFKCYARSARGTLIVTATSRIIVRVVSNDGTTYRGTVLSFGDKSTATNWNTSDRNKAFADGDDATASVAALNGDYIVLELGLSHTATVDTAQISIGDDSATDLAEDETTTTANNPWLDIFQGIKYTSNPQLGTPPWRDPRTASNYRRHHKEYNEYSYTTTRRRLRRGPFPDRESRLLRCHAKQRATSKVQVGTNRRSRAFSA